METVFGNNLKRLRRNNGLTQRELAKKLGITHATIASYETRGKYPMRKDIRDNLIKVLKCKEHELFGYDKPGASYIEYATVDLLNMSHVNQIDDILTDEKGHPVPDSVLMAHGKSGKTSQILSEEINKTIPFGSHAYFIKEKDIKEYNDHICAIIRDNSVIYRRVYIMGNNAVLETESITLKNTKEFIDLDKEELNIAGRCVWFEHNQEGL